MSETDLTIRAGVTIRPATVDDAEKMVEMRAHMFREMGWSDEARVEQFIPIAVTHLRESFSAGECNGFIAEEERAEGVREVIGVVALVWQRVAPTIRNLEGRVAYVLGMYVVPERRRLGIARVLMEAVVECALDNGAPLIALHASDEGRLLYEQLGFKPAPEMRLFTDHASPPAWSPVYDAD
jgi:GNAT superfamily N-acetyltransferase